MASKKNSGGCGDEKKINCGTNQIYFAKTPGDKMTTLVMRRIKLDQHGETLAILVEDHKNNTRAIEYKFDGGDHRVAIDKEIANKIKAK
jgi:hypothetical protein